MQCRDHRKGVGVVFIYILLGVFDRGQSPGTKCSLRTNEGICPFAVTKGFQLLRTAANQDSEGHLFTRPAAISNRYEYRLLPQPVRVLTTISSQSNGMIP